MMVGYFDWGFSHEHVFASGLTLTMKDKDLIADFVESQWAIGSPWMVARERNKPIQRHKAQIRRGKAGELAFVRLAELRGKRVIYDFDNAKFRGKHDPDVVIFQGDVKINFHLKTTFTQNGFRNWRIRNSLPIIREPKFFTKCVHENKEYDEVDFMLLILEDTEYYPTKYTILKPFPCTYLKDALRPVPPEFAAQYESDNSSFLNVPEILEIYQAEQKRLSA